MAEHLVFTLYGPLQAWGTVAVGEVRPSAGHPTRSAVLGLLAAALGIRRGEDDALLALSDGYGLAIRTDAPGERFTDYHTVQAPGEKKKRTFHSRRDELGAKLGPHEELHTILSRRDYLADARFTVCLRPRGIDVPHSLQALRDALLAPRLTPYLGRKCCPMALPFQPQIVDAEDALAALDAYDPALGALWRTPGQGAGDVFCDEGMCHGAPRTTFTVRDVLEAPSRRGFVTRSECLHRPDSSQGGA